MYNLFKLLFWLKTSLNVSQFSYENSTANFNAFSDVVAHKALLNKKDVLKGTPSTNDPARYREQRDLDRYPKLSQSSFANLAGRISYIQYDSTGKNLYIYIYITVCLSVVLLSHLGQLTSTYQLLNTISLLFRFVTAS